MDAINYFKFLIVLVLVIGLILVLAAGLKKLGFATGSRPGLGRRRRLSTVESALLDGRHRVVLVRRDDVEHLVLVGPNTSQVIETGIPAAPAGGDTVENPTVFAAFGQLLAREKQP
jgi:flagellar protein FliO/FliZ